MAEEGALLLDTSFLFEVINMPNALGTAEEEIKEMDCEQLFYKRNELFLLSI